MVARLTLSKESDKRAVLYLRMSSDPQKDSILQQRMACMRYAMDNGYKVVGEYADEGISGVSSRSKRKGFQAMVADATNSKFSYVICWELNRCSRSKPREFIVEMDPLANAGVKLVLTDKGVIDLDTFEGAIQAMAGAHSNNEFVISLSRLVVRGQHAKAQMGLHVAGSPPFGFKLAEVLDDAGNPVLTKLKKPLTGRIVHGDPEDVQTVRLIYQWYLEGISYRGICMRLQTERGLKKSNHFVSKVLSHPYYVGDYRWNENSHGRFNTIRDGVVTSKREISGETTDQDKVLIVNNHEPIIDRETYLKVQAAIAARKTKTSPFLNGGQSILTGLCWCAGCGSKFTSQTHKRKGYSDRVVLKCNGYTTGRCKGNYVSQDEVVSHVVASTIDWVQGKGLKELRSSMEQKLRSESETVDPRKLEKELSAKRVKYERMRSRFADLPENLVADCAADLGKIKTEIDGLESRLKSVRTSSKSQLASFDRQAGELLQSVVQLQEAVTLVSRTKPHLIRELIANFAEKITLDVKDLGAGRRPRFVLNSGKIHLSSSYNLLPHSYWGGQVIRIPLQIDAAWREPLSLDLIRQWYLDHYQQHQSFPCKSSPELCPDGSTWLDVQRALNLGGRGLEKMKWVEFVDQVHADAGIAVQTKTLTLEWITELAVEHHTVFGKLPTERSVEQPADGITWFDICRNLQRGYRGLPKMKWSAFIQKVQRRINSR